MGQKFFCTQNHYGDTRATVNVWGYVPLPPPSPFSEATTFSVVLYCGKHSRKISGKLRQSLLVKSSSSHSFILYTLRFVFSTLSSFWSWCFFYKYCMHVCICVLCRHLQAYILRTRRSKIKKLPFNYFLMFLSFVGVPSL